MGGAKHRYSAAAAAAALLLLVLLISISFSSVHSQSIGGGGSSSSSSRKPFVTYSFPIFDPSFQGENLTVFKDASINQGTLQITPDSLNDPSKFLARRSGRVFFSKPLKLWSSNSSSSSSPNYTTNITNTYVATFSTIFNLNIYRPDNTSNSPGEGFAFLIAPSLDPPPPNSYGGFLGLTNASTDGNATNKFIAIELDTVKQPYDPDNNHIGLDVNGVHSYATSSLTPFGIEISPPSSTNYTVWIDYNGTTRHIWVYMAVEGQPKPQFDVFNASVDLSRFIPEHAYMGFSASTGERYELNCLLGWNITVEKLEDDSGHRGLRGWKLGLVIGIPSAVMALVAGSLVGLHIQKMRRRVRDDPTVLFNPSNLIGTPKEFDYKELRKGTSNFDDKMKLGQGGYGVVFKATVMGDNGHIEVAVKQFSRANTKGQEDFLAELSIINRLRHRNLVRLVGWCHQNGVLLLVYDYMLKGSLDQHLFGAPPEKPILNWEQRYNIVTGVASALHYLHHEYDQMVIHRDIKPSNIMLDSAFNPRLGDFGLARALESDKTSYTDHIGVPGTLGYIAPECFHTGKATRESDIFGFGAVILETVCGRRLHCNSAGCSQLVEWVWQLHGAGRIVEAVDPRLAGDFDEPDAERLLLLGLACSHPNPGERPRAQAIVPILSRSVPLPFVPPSKPAFMWPALPAVYADDDGEMDSSSKMASTVRTSSDYASSSSAWTHNNISRDEDV